jgi:hypothetical protein
MPFFSFPTTEDPRQKAMALFHLADRRTFFEEGTGRADLHAFTAFGATDGVAPGAIQGSYYQAVGTAAHDIQGVCALHFVADPDTA